MKRGKCPRSRDTCLVVEEGSKGWSAANGIFDRDDSDGFGYLRQKQW